VIGSAVHRVRLNGRVAASVGVLVTAIVLGGCGGHASPRGNPQDFKRAYLSERSKVNQLIQAVGYAFQSAKSQPAAAVAAQYRSLATQLQVSVAKLEKLTPPASVATDYARIKSGLAKLPGYVNRLAATSGSGAPGADHAILRQLIADVGVVRAAAARLRAKLGLPAPPKAVGSS
jgi:hypothetical protein